MDRSQQQENMTRDQNLFEVISPATAKEWQVKRLSNDKQEATSVPQ
jgi:hypothetical protein